MLDAFQDTYGGKGFSMSADAKIKELKIELPPAPKPAASWLQIADTGLNHMVQGIHKGSCVNSGSKGSAFIAAFDHPSIKR